ncbi:MAG: histidine kinase dimerization/phospho-acceptor domain-containing protein, partial [Cyanobacteria bacterium J06641_5]
MGDPYLNPNPLPQPSQSLGSVLLLAADKNDTSPAVKLLQARGIDARVGSLAAATRGNFTELTDTAAVVWFLATQTLDREDSPEIVLPCWRAAGYGGAAILVADRLDPSILATFFRAGLTDYLELAALDELPQALQRATSTLSTLSATTHLVLEQRVRQLEREKKELIAASHIRDDFFATMSHELRAPLANILGFAKMLRDRVYGPLNDRQLQYASSLYTCSEYLLELMNN